MMLKITAELSTIPVKYKRNCQQLTQHKMSLHQRTLRVVKNSVGYEGSVQIRASGDLLDNTELYMYGIYRLCRQGQNLRNVPKFNEMIEMGLFTLNKILVRGLRHLYGLEVS